MRKVTKDICNAFVARQSRTIGNSHTDGDRLLLHGNVIALWKADGALEVTLAGWPTPTTRERLNGLPGVRAWQEKHRQYINGREVGANEWVRIPQSKRDTCDNPQTVTCGNCGRSWCERCDPCPSAMCHWCNGLGYSNAQVIQEARI